MATENNSRNQVIFYSNVRLQLKVPSAFLEPTHTDRYHAELHHAAQKQSTINSLVHRAFIISDKEYLQTELNHLKLALQKNG